MAYKSAKKPLEIRENWIDSLLNPGHFDTLFEMDLVKGQTKIFSKPPNFFILGQNKLIFLKNWESKKKVDNEE